MGGESAPVAVAIVPLAGAAPVELRVHGRTALEWALAALASVPALAEIVVAPQIEIPAETIESRPHVRWSPCRADRLAAIQAALQMVEPHRPVLVHDADQALVGPGWLAAVLGGAADHPAVASVLPVKSACKQVVEGVVERNVPREGLVRILGPRAFQGEVLRQVVGWAASDGRREGDEVRAALAAGVPVAAHHAPGPNVRVTGPASAELVSRLAADGGR